jgi:hypothetical protein
MSAHARINNGLSTCPGGANVLQPIVLVSAPGPMLWATQQAR